MPRPTRDSACVVNTSVFQGNSMISQDSSCSDQEMEVQIPPCFPPSTSQSQPFVQPHVYVIYRRSKDGLDCE